MLTSAVSGGSTTIDGTLNSATSTEFRIELFSNGACDPSGHGEGETFLGFTTTTTDGSGNASFSLGLAATVAAGRFITATATDPNGNTSEFSACAVVTAPVVDVPLVSGFNLIGIPVRFAATTTFADLAQQVADQGGQVSSVLAWDEPSQAFVSWVRNEPDMNNLDLEEGRGYFVRVVTPPSGGAWRATGVPITEGVPLGFAPGYNLVSVPFSAQPYDATSLAQAIRNAGGAASSILKWKARAQTFITWVAVNPKANPLDILPTAGYFVRVTQPTPSPFTP